MNLTEWVISIMEQLGYLGIAILMFLDNVFPPIPSEIIMPSAGYTASQNQLLLVGVIIAGCIGSLLAAALLYWIGYKFKHETIFNFVDRYGKFLFIKSEDVKKSLSWFEKYGHRIVFFGRMIPAVRSLISIPAGMSRMPFWKFMFYSSLGTIIWTTFLACIGFYFGENQALMQKIFSQVGYFIIGIVLIIVAWIWYRRNQRKSRIL
ncbi:DedA family protein [Acinetobacter faecalis]|uniref:DedA family protein n=1 Tax=Acinetobacter faecalis TaxID=2665161 RepID=UPI002A9188E1|nr:DedA family protein [Acinetobacter faecalis]MDY6449853.1 DedA family protein [Acinetobacter faecalis]MDY6457204.1 DedA family protein [Acinetobacter faecalis]MDY6467328.1 DedA family protein [Acinetobacter faecalis]